MTQSPIKKIASPEEKLRIVASWVIVMLCAAFGVFALYKLSYVHQTEGEYWKNLIQAQFPVVVGLPMAGLGALFLTLVLRISSGPLEFEVGAFKFKGSAAPIVFWLACFLSITLSIGLLWQKPC